MLLHIYILSDFQETDENLNFDEMILEAAKSITAATHALVKAASDSQRELIDQVIFTKIIINLYFKLKLNILFMYREKLQDVYTKPQMMVNGQKDWYLLLDL